MLGAHEADDGEGGLLRRAATRSEQMLSEALRGGQVDGLKWRRRQQIERFVVDFFCAEKRLVVEIDGGVHADPRQADLERERVSNGIGSASSASPQALSKTSCRGPCPIAQGSFPLPLRERGLVRNASAVRGARVRGSQGPTSIPPCRPKTRLTLRQAPPLLQPPNRLPLIPRRNHPLPTRPRTAPAPASSTTHTATTPASTHAFAPATASAPATTTLTTPRSNSARSIANRPRADAHCPHPRPRRSPPPQCPSRSRRSFGLTCV